MTRKLSFEQPKPIICYEFLDEGRARIQFDLRERPPEDRAIVEGIDPPKEISDVLNSPREFVYSFYDHEAVPFFWIGKSFPDPGYTWKVAESKEELGTCITGMYHPFYQLVYGLSLDTDKAKAFVLESHQKELSELTEDFFESDRERQEYFLTQVFERDYLKTEIPDNLKALVADKDLLLHQWLKDFDSKKKAEQKKIVQEYIIDDLKLVLE